MTAWWQLQGSSCPPISNSSNESLQSKSVIDLTLSLEDYEKKKSFLVHYKLASRVNVWPSTNLPTIKAMAVNVERDKDSLCVNFTPRIACGESYYAIKGITP